MSLFGGANQSVLTRLATCIGIPSTNIDTSPVEAASEQYQTSRSWFTVNDNVEVFPTKSDAVVDAKATANRKTPNCLVKIERATLSQRITQALGPGSKVGHMRATHGLVTGYGDHSADVRIIVPVTYQGGDHTFYFENVVVQKGRSETILRFTSMDAPPPIPTVNAFARSATVWMSQTH